MRRNRRRRGWSLRVLAGKVAERGVEVSHSQLSKVERRLSTPHPALAAVLVELLDLDIDDLEREEAA